MKFLKFVNSIWLGTVFLAGIAFAEGGAEKWKWANEGGTEYSPQVVTCLGLDKSCKGVNRVCHGLVLRNEKEKAKRAYCYARPDGCPSADDCMKEGSNRMMKTKSGDYEFTNEDRLLNKTTNEYMITLKKLPGSARTTPPPERATLKPLQLSE